MTYFIQIFASFLAVILVITLHEFAHAFVAYKCGDPTAKFSGRLTLNPIRHFDLLGMVIFALTGFGWAKPVPVNPNNFKKYRSGSFWTSAAGIIVNYLSAFLFYPIYVLVFIYVLPHFTGMYMYVFLEMLFRGLFVYSLSFCIFNLLPFYPLDGFRMVDAFSTQKGKVYRFLRKYSHYILLALVFFHFISGKIPYLHWLDPLGYVLSFAQQIFGKPITLFWNWIFKLCGLF